MNMLTGPMICIEQGRSQNLISGGVWISVILKLEKEKKKEKEILYFSIKTISIIFSGWIYFYYEKSGA